MNNEDEADEHDRTSACEGVLGTSMKPHLAMWQGVAEAGELVTTTAGEGFLGASIKLHLSAIRLAVQEQR